MDQEEMKPKKAKAAKPKKPKKPKRQENKGISGVGTDYTMYILSAGQRLLAMAVGFAVGFGAAYIYFSNVTLGIFVGVVAAWKAIGIYRKKLQADRLRLLRLQFRDLLESLSNSYTVGMTGNRAFHNAYSDMMTEHGKNAYITKEVQLICAMHDNQGVDISDMVNDFAERSGLDDVRSFASVFEVSSALGGDVAKVIRETRDMIGDKIEIELEIQTMVTGQRSQLNILAIMPLVMALLTRAFSDGPPTTLTVIVKSAALVLFVFAYWMGTRIVDIKV